jgi:hypothetical protein
MNKLEGLENLGLNSSVSHKADEYKHQVHANMTSVIAMALQKTKDQTCCLSGILVQKT